MQEQQKCFLSELTRRSSHPLDGDLEVFYWGRLNVHNSLSDPTFWNNGLGKEVQ